jgi:hypothetical protein
MDTKRILGEIKNFTEHNPPPEIAGEFYKKVKEGEKPSEKLIYKINDHEINCGRIISIK